MRQGARVALLAGRGGRRPPPLPLVTPRKVERGVVGAGGAGGADTAWATRRVQGACRLASPTSSASSAHITRLLASTGSRRRTTFLMDAPTGTATTATTTRGATGTAGAVALLDREAFQETLHLVALRIPQRMTEPFLKRLGGGGYLFSRPRVKVVIPDTNGSSSEEDTSVNTNKLILLSESVADADLRQLPDELRQFVLANAQVTSHTLQLGYPHLSIDQVLKRVLPPDVPAVSSFETVGHIAHLNLRDEHLPYRYIIGQVVLDKNPRLRTVVNKTQSINTTYRTFAMEVIAGQDDLNAEVSESGCRFAFNYGEVYWNSRLQQEHHRLLKKIKPHDIVCDMFAGVGPFAVPAAKNIRCKVYANDLNPKSYAALLNNAARNKVQNLIKAYNMDARDFVRALYRENPPVPFSQVIMNLPASAELFLDVFREFPPELACRPTIHCYVFTKDRTDPLADVIRRVEEVLQCSLEEREIYEVRDVSPKKLMMCVSFPLPRAAFSQQTMETGTKRKDAPEDTNEGELKESEEESLLNDRARSPSQPSRSKKTKPDTSDTP